MQSLPSEQLHVRALAILHDGREHSPATIEWAMAEVDTTRRPLPLSDLGRLSEYEKARASATARGRAAW